MDSLPTQKCVVFGGGGFIGSAIVDRLLADKHELRIFERPRVEPYRAFSNDEQVEWMTGDFSSIHDVATALEGMDVVYHLVSTTLPKSSNDDLIYDVHSNLVATIQLLNLMREQGVKRIVFISSGGTVYGPPEYLPINEAHPNNPVVSYGIVKLAIEKYLLMFERLYGLKTVILRVANPYGERQRIETAQGAIGVFLKRAMARESIDVWGDGSVTRDYLHVGDVAEAFAKALRYVGSGSVFNISSGTGVSLNELLGIIENVLGRAVARNYLPGRPFDVPASVLDNSLARSELGWSPLVSLETGIRRTAEWIDDQLS